MKNKIKYTDGPIGDIEIVDDFLPPPEKLVKKDANIKVTINLNKSSVNFFKKLASSSKTKYQKIIRNLLDHYVSRHSLAHKH